MSESADRPVDNLSDVFDFDREALTVISVALRRLRLSGERLADRDMADVLQEQIDRALIVKMKRAVALSSGSEPWESDGSNKSTTTKI